MHVLPEEDFSGQSGHSIMLGFREVLVPEILEECILSATIKHLSLAETVQHLHAHEEINTEEYRLLMDVMAEMYRRHYAMIRQLQVWMTSRC